MNQHFHEVKTKQIQNSHEFIAARDPVGIRPLYYGYDSKGSIVFASEPKNLT